MSVTYVTTSFGIAPAPGHSNRERSSRIMRQYHRPASSASILASAATASSTTPSSSGSGSGSGSRQTSSSISSTVLPPAPPRPTHQAARAQYSEIEAFFGGQRQSQSQSQSQSSPTPSGRTRSPASAAPPPPPRSSTSTSTSSTTREPRRSERTSSTGYTLPPQYESQPPFDVESLPSYSKMEEYNAELNRKLFLYGFLFFPFWIIGIIAPFVKPTHNPAIDNRTKEDQEIDDIHIRKVEMRWAKRCGIALLAFIAIITIAAVVGVTVSKSHHH